MNKKLVLLFWALLTTALPTLAYDFMVDGLCYNKNSDGKSVTVTYELAFPAYTSLSGTITIPETVTNSGTTYFVTSIGRSAFFYCSGLTSVTIPNSVTSIDVSAFGYCSGLTSVTIPNSVTLIGDMAFSGCDGLTSVTIPNSVTSIGNSAFSGCSGLTRITIPNSVTFIDVYAFNNCSGLTSIIVETENTTYDSRNNCNAIIETASNTLIAGCKNSTIPNSVTSIAIGAFYRCSGLTSITIPNSVTSIGNIAFSNCSNLMDIQSYPKPSNVTMGQNVFNGVPTSANLHVLPEHMKAYTKANQWKVFNIVDDLTEDTTDGDVNGDGSVNAGDVSAVYNVMLGSTTDAAVVARADVNSDGAVNAGDVSAVYNIMLSD